MTGGLILSRAGDQYIGSLYSRLGITFSLMSAPWLLVPFMAGCTQLRARRAALAGAAATLAALAGYITMILSPVEGVHGLTARQILLTVFSQGRWLLAAFVSGPVLGLLGQRWRTHRSWLGAILATTALLFEPVVRGLFRMEGGDSLAFAIELIAGLVTATYFAVTIKRSRTSLVPPT